MSATVIANTLAGQEPPVAPTKADGSSYAYSMHYGDFSHIAYADSAVELLDIIIPGYANMDDLHRSTARQNYALGVQVSLRTGILINTPNVSADEFRVLSSNDRAPQVSHWNSYAPLVLLSTDYADGTNSVQGNVMWLCPEEDQKLLDSLNETGSIVVTSL